MLGDADGVTLNDTDPDAEGGRSTVTDTLGDVLGVAVEEVEPESEGYTGNSVEVGVTLGVGIKTYILKVGLGDGVGVGELETAIPVILI